jgi:hypothetical protein
MSTVVSDSFTRSDAANLGSNWTDVIAGWQVVSNQAEAENAVAPGWNAATYTGTDWKTTDDQWAQLTIITKPLNSHIGASVRASTSVQTYYTGQTNSGAVGSGTNDQYLLYKIVAGSITLLMNGGTIALNDVVRTEAQGSAIRLLKNGSVVVTATDSAIATGNPGIHSRVLAAGAFSVGDDWSAGDFALSGGSFPIKRPHQIWKAKL